MQYKLQPPQALQQFDSHVECDFGIMTVSCIIVRYNFDIINLVAAVQKGNTIVCMARRLFLFLRRVI